MCGVAAAGFVADPHTMANVTLGRVGGGPDPANRSAAKMEGWSPHSLPTAYPPTGPRRTAAAVTPDAAPTGGRVRPRRPAGAGGGEPALSTGPDAPRRRRAAGGFGCRRAAHGKEKPLERSPKDMALAAVLLSPSPCSPSTARR
jgi:hypothetical protein